MSYVRELIKDISCLFYPPLCITCGERLLSQEKYICINCWLDLPRTRFHNDKNNKVAKLFWGRVYLEHATSYFHYFKGSRYQNLIHAIKYNGLKELGEFTGERFGNELAKCEIYNDTDIIVPVPLHPKKLKKRGYNQSEWIAKGIAKALKKPINTKVLIRNKFTPTQTKKNRYERWENVTGVFMVTNDKIFENKHILLIDDVVTTGATLEACALLLKKINGTKVSIATLAFADF